MAATHFNRWYIGSSITMASHVGNLWLILCPLPASASEAAGAQVLDWGTNKDEYKSGDSVTGFIKIKNTGSTVIHDMTVSVKVLRQTLLGEIEVHHSDYNVADFIQDFRISPGESKEFRFPPTGQPPFTIPNTPLARGKYRFIGRLVTGGKDLGKIEKKIRIV